MGIYVPQENLSALFDALRTKVEKKDFNATVKRIKTLRETTSKATIYRELDKAGYVRSDIARICATAWGIPVRYQEVFRALAMGESKRELTEKALAEAKARIKELESQLRAAKKKKEVS